MKKVLSIGQCAADQFRLNYILKEHFDVEVAAAANEKEALNHLRSGACDLVLINRQMDEDGASGHDIIVRLKGDPSHQGLPVMLVSDFEDAQARAVSAGALAGFGKAELGTKKMLDRIRPILES